MDDLNDITTIAPPSSFDPDVFQQCVNSSGFKFRPWDPHNEKAIRGHFMSTVEAKNDEPIGFATHHDWILGIRPWKRNLKVVGPDIAWGHTKRLPDSIFIQVLQQQRFHDHLLPCIPKNHHFVLVTGDDDRTTPRQSDKRYESPIMKPGTWESWLNDKRISHLFVEHLDSPMPSNRVTPIPLGLNPREFKSFTDGAAVKELEGAVKDFSKRDMSVLFTNRVRNGDQWVERGQARDLCQALPHCTEARIDQRDFLREIKNHTFLICVHGGGVDPNPNLFQALIAGVIPIMAPFPGDSMYEGLPIVVTDGDWNNPNSEFFSPEYLSAKLEELAPFFEDPEKRAQVVDRLTMKYWWNKVETEIKKNQQLQ
ncbi:MAG: hypothetical protein SGBAC_012888 [Bacillariaceae sp.]